MPRLPTLKGDARWLRSLLVVATLLLAWTSVTQAGSMIFQWNLPRIALWFDAEEPVALIRAAKEDLAVGGTQGNQGAAAIDAATRSIARNPLNKDAFGIFGLVSLANTDPERTSRRMAMADRLSRRDLGAQLFLIEDAVRRNDVAEALRHYDTAMRISESVRPSLYPVLTEAIREPAIRARFLPYMNASTPWLEPFLRHAIGNSSDPASIVALAVEAGGFPEGPRFATRVPELLSVLVAQGDYASARRLFEVVAGGDPAILTTAPFNDETTGIALAPFTWQPFQVDGIDSMFISGGQSGLELESRMDSGFTGSVVRKLFALSPGAYAAAIPVASQGHAPGDAAIMRVACVAGGDAQMILNAREDLAEETTLRGAFVVPAGCAYQMVTVLVETQTRPGGVVLTLGSPAIARR